MKASTASILGPAGYLSGDRKSYGQLLDRLKYVTGRLPPLPRVRSPTCGGKTQSGTCGRRRVSSLGIRTGAALLATTAVYAVVVKMMARAGAVGQMTAKSASLAPDGHLRSGFR